MTTFNTIEEFLDILDNDPRLLEAVRNKILSDDLMKLPNEVSEFRKDSEKFQEETRKSFDGIDTRLDEQGKKLDSIDTRLDSFRGYALENAMASRLRQRIGRLLDLKRVRVVRQTRHIVLPLRRGENFHDSLDAALNDGRILDSEYTRIEDTDLVVTALRNSDNSRVYIAVEASGTINDDDISRARQSAGILNKMYNEEAIPAVYGFSIEAPQTDLARANPDEGKPEVHILLEEDNL